MKVCTYRVCPFFNAICQALRDTYRWTNVHVEDIRWSTLPVWHLRAMKLLWVKVIHTWSPNGKSSPFLNSIYYTLHRAFVKLNIIILFITALVSRGVYWRDCKLHAYQSLLRTSVHKMWLLKIVWRHWPKGVRCKRPTLNTACFRLTKLFFYLCGL